MHVWEESVVVEVVWTMKGDPSHRTCPGDKVLLTSLVSR
jgi:hypothetical protein